MAAKEESRLSAYAAFLKSKEVPDQQYGFAPIWLPDYLKPFQRHLDDWAIRKGKAALMCDCGTGKSPMQLVYLENCVRHCNRPALLVTPLAVGPQMVREGEKFGIQCKQSRDGIIHKGITVTNYEQLGKFHPNDFCAVGYDESSCLKALDSKTRKETTEFASKIHYCLLATATPAPNDWTELGTSAECLKVMSYHRMLGTFFTNGGEQSQDWSLKGHAKKRFWRWVCTWARALRKPSDLGFSDEDYDLPPLTVQQHVVESPRPKRGFGLLGAATLQAQREERRATLQQRCEKVAELVQGKDDYALVYCHLNDEGNLLEKLMPGSVQVSGNDSDLEKEYRLNAFAQGQIKCLVTKPKIGGWGLNLQHCNRVFLFPSHSFESYYQCVRRCWRFGQLRPVQVNIVTSHAECRVVDNMQQKERAANEMFSSLVDSMQEYQNRKQEQIRQPTQLPGWLKGYLPCR